MDYPDTANRDDETLTFAAAEPHTPEVVGLLGALSTTLREITGNSGEGSFKPEDVQDARAVLVVARLAGCAVGCGALRPIDAETGELKRMFVAQPRRGIGGQLLAELEQRARLLGYARIVLETRKVNSAAVDFYLKHGYRVIPNYGKYAGRPEAICFEKRLREKTAR